MEKIKILILTTLWILVIINIWQFRGYIHTQRWMKFFDTWEFKNASQEFQKVKDITSLYNDANSLYKQGKFEEAIQKYWLLSTWDTTSLDIYQYYNKGNSLYKQWIQDPIYREDLRKQAITSYNLALSLQDDEDTKYNKLVVEKALKKLQENKQSNSSNSSNSQNNSENQKNSSTWNSDANKKGDSSQKDQNDSSLNGENSTSQSGIWGLINTWNMNPGSWTNHTYEENWTGAVQSWSVDEQSTTNENEEMNDGNKEGQSNEFSQEQLQAIQDYKQELSDQQKQYGQYYNKTYKDESNDPFERFFNDPFFDNGLLNWDNTNKKDW